MTYSDPDARIHAANGIPHPDELELTADEIAEERAIQADIDRGYQDFINEDLLPRRCRQAETTRDCPRTHNWYGNAAYHRS